MSDDTTPTPATGAPAGATPAADATPGATPDTPPATGATQDTTPAYDTWLAQQDEATRAILDRRFQALTNTVDALRSDRKDALAQVKALQKQVTDDNPLKETVNALTQQLEMEQKRADFTEEMAQAGCISAKTAWHIAQAENLDAAQLQATYPHLFRRTVPATHAGAGAGKPADLTPDMNAAIRKAAGVR